MPPPSKNVRTTFWGKKKCTKKCRTLARPPPWYIPVICRDPTIYKAYFLGLCEGISPQNMAKHMVLTYLHFRILDFPLKGHVYMTNLYLPSKKGNSAAGHIVFGFQHLGLTCNPPTYRLPHQIFNQAVFRHPSAQFHLSMDLFILI